MLGVMTKPAKDRKFERAFRRLDVEDCRLLEHIAEHRPAVVDPLPGTGPHVFSPEHGLVLQDAPAGMTSPRVLLEEGFVEVYEQDGLKRLRPAPWYGQRALKRIRMEPE